MKFGLRGIGNALREHVRKYGIGVTCINPGEIAAQIPYEDGVEKAIAAYHGTRIPVQDIVSLVKCVANLSKISCVKEINFPQCLIPTHKNIGSPIVAGLCDIRLPGESEKSGQRLTAFFHPALPSTQMLQN